MIDSATASTAPSENQRQHLIFSIRQQQQRLDVHPPAKFDTIGSGTKSLMARLALTQRYQTCPCAPISRETSDAVNDYCQRKALSADLCKSKTSKVIVKLSMLQLISANLDKIHSTASLTRSDARWLRGDQLLASIQIAITNHPLLSRLKNEYYLLDETAIPDWNIFGTVDSVKMELMWLWCARLTIRLLTTSSSSAAHHAQESCAQREARMQKALLNPASWLLERKAGLESELDVERLLQSTDFPLIYLGNPLQPPEGTLAKIRLKVETALDRDSSKELLYLQLMLRHDTFFVHCTGATHIIGGWSGRLANT